jgi:hypothetical protein
MATEPLDHRNIPDPVEGLAAHPISGTRGQAMQRLQVGLFGIASMVLLVGLANVVLTNARQNATVQGKVASDPLAEAGIVPDLPSPSQTQTQTPIEVAPPPPLTEPGDALTRP